MHHISRLSAIRGCVGDEQRRGLGPLRGLRAGPAAEVLLQAGADRGGARRGPGPLGPGPLGVGRDNHGGLALHDGFANLTKS